VLERVEGGRHQVSVCAGTPAVLGMGRRESRPSRAKIPQTGMANMRGIIPPLQ